MPGIQEILSRAEQCDDGSGATVSSSLPLRQTRSWQQSLAGAVRDVPTLLAKLELHSIVKDFSEKSSVEFPVLVPESYLRRMEVGNPNDPLLRQVLPVLDEELNPAGFADDPVGDEQARVAPGMLHKYFGRALLIAHSSCAVHCRYCFRRHFPYQDEPHSVEQWGPALEAIREDSSLKEIILSGGDPLILSDRRLGLLISQLEDIPHLRRLRIHSRLPIVLPDRITSELCSLLTSTRLRTVFVLHSNHARELTCDCAEAIEKLRLSGIPMLNQAVLLKGVNDDVEQLTELCERCVDLGVMPYYLHQLDRVRGASHFEVPVEIGRKLIDELRTRLPGYAVPKYVAEIPGEPSKTPIL